MTKGFHNPAAPAAPGRRPYQLLGIAGSLRAQSFSKALLEALAAASADRAEYVYADIGVIPHFDQDVYTECVPAAAMRFREQIATSHGLIISSPEYNHGMPSVLKNAIEWASRPHNASPLKGKPVLIMTSSVAYTGGVRAQHEIREAVTSALARNVVTPEIVVGGIDSKMGDGQFRDETAITFALQGLKAMFEEVDRMEREPSAA